MCLVKKPTIRDDGSTKNGGRDIPILRNPLLDGMAGSINSIRMGRNALRIDRGSPGGRSVGGYTQASSGGGYTAPNSTSTTTSRTGTSGGGSNFSGSGTNQLY